MCEDEIEQAKNYFYDTVVLLVLMVIVLTVLVLKENHSVQDTSNQPKEKQWERGYSK